MAGFFLRFNLVLMVIVAGIVTGVATDMRLALIAGLWGRKAWPLPLALDRSRGGNTILIACVAIKVDDACISDNRG